MRATVNVSIRAFTTASFHWDRWCQQNATTQPDTVMACRAVLSIRAIHQTPLWKPPIVVRIHLTEDKSYRYYSNTCLTNGRKKAREWAKKRHPFQLRQYSATKTAKYQIVIQFKQLQHLPLIIHSLNVLIYWKYFHNSELQCYSTRRLWN